MAALGVNFGLWAIAVIPTYFVIRKIGLIKKEESDLEIDITSGVKTFDHSDLGIDNTNRQ